MHDTYIKITGEPFLSRAREYRERRDVWMRAWLDYAKRKGAESFAENGRELGFKPGKQPEGWTKPRGKHGYSHPKKRHRDEAEMASMRRAWPKLKVSDVYGDAVLRNFSWEDPAGKTVAGYAIGGFDLVINGPWVGWAGDTFLGHIPDPEAAVRAHREEHPGDRILEPAASWTLPAGLERITQAEYELVYAQWKVEEERRAAEEAGGG